MEEKKLVPKLRFPGFTEPWEQRKLGDLFKERNERSEQGDLISVTISQGVIKASDLDRDINSSVDKHNYKRVRSGDVVYNTMRMWQGACGHSPYEGILSPAYTVLIPGEDTLGKLFDYYFKRTELLQIFKKYSQGMTSDTWNLKFDILKHISLPLPSVEEQVEIAQLFSKYDNLITLHQRKLEHLKLKKKSLLQKLFPKEGEVNPELRFPGFTDPWEQRKFGDLFEYERPDAYIVKSDNYNNDFNMPVLTANKAFILGYTNEENSYNKPSIIFDDFTLDRKYVDFPYMLKSSAIKILTSKNQHNLRFLFERLNSTRFEVLGHARHYISVVQNTTTLCPSVDEEVCISNLLTKFDELITLHQRKLEHLQLLKKALLQQLFV